MTAAVTGPQLSSHRLTAAGGLDRGDISLLLSKYQSENLNVAMEMLASHQELGRGQSLVTDSVCACVYVLGGGGGTTGVKF